MSVTLEELIKWILLQTADQPDDETREIIRRRVFTQDKEDGHEQK